MAIILPSRLAARQVPSCRWPHKAKRSLSVMRSTPTMATGDEDHWQDRSHATPPMPPSACCGAYGVPPSSVLDYTRIPSIRVALHETVVQCTRKGNGGPAILLLARSPAEPGGRAWTPNRLLPPSGVPEERIRTSNGIFTPPPRPRGDSGSPSTRRQHAAVDCSKAWRGNARPGHAAEEA
jgi:hypothetical protein